MNAAPFQSPLAPVLTGFLALKRALGRRYAGEEAVLRSLDAFLACQQPPADLTAAMFAAWGQTLQRLAPTVRRRWLSVVRMVCRYRQRTDSTCFVPDPTLFPRPHQPVTPYIFTVAEIARLLQLADALPPTPGVPLQAAVYRLAVVLLYTTGLRRGELLRLTVGDYDPIAQTLHVRASKFHKSRCVPLAADGVQELERYLAARRARRLPVTPETPLLASAACASRAYTGEGLAQGLRRLFRAAGIRTPRGRPPRVHDLRHTCAVHALLRWYAAGADPQAKLPMLATYLGHVSIVSTEVYLHFIAPLGAAASTRFAERCGALIAAPGGGGGGAG